MHGLRPTNTKKLQSLQAQALRVCLGVPKCTCTLDTIPESHEPSIAALRTKETFRNHFRHLTRHHVHRLANIPERCFNSRIVREIFDQTHILPTFCQRHNLLATAPWPLPPIKIYSTILGFTKKSMLANIRQISLCNIHFEHCSLCQIYTDACTTYNH